MDSSEKSPESSRKLNLTKEEEVAAIEHFRSMQGRFALVADLNHGDMHEQFNDPKFRQKWLEDGFGKWLAFLRVADKHGLNLAEELGKATMRTRLNYLHSKGVPAHVENQHPRTT